MKQRSAHAHCEEDITHEETPVIIVNDSADNQPTKIVFRADHFHIVDSEIAGWMELVPTSKSM